MARQTFLRTRPRPSNSTDGHECGNRPWTGVWPNVCQCGQAVGGAIEKYGLNKEKRAKLTGEIEAYYKENPNAISEIGMSGDEAQDKKDFLEREKFIKGDMNAGW